MKIKYAIIFLIIILATNGVFANCNVEILDNSPLKGKVSCDCNHEKLECNCNINDSVLVKTTAPPFSLTSCNDYKINFYTNGYNFLLKSDYFNFNFFDYTNINLIANNNSKITIYEDAKSITLPNIIVNSEKKLDIKTYSPLQATDKSHDVNIESIFVYPNANLNLNLKSNDGKIGNRSFGYGVDAFGNNYYAFLESKHGTRSGYVNLKINNIQNYGFIDIDLKTGNGGDGQSFSGGDTGTIHDGGFSAGDGDNSGDLNFSIKQIENYNNLKISLETGKGGKGGYSEKDEGPQDETYNGGNGGNAGNIFISNIDKITNYKSIIFNATAGDGGSGGVQRAENYDDHCKDGHNGDGGHGGNISDIKINTFLNKLNSSEFKLNIKNGALGDVDISPDGTCAPENSASFGIPGKIGDITIDFLENKSSNGFEITSNFNFTNHQYDLAVIATSNNGYDGEDNGGNILPLPYLNLKLSDIKINYLSNGSYLPKTISAGTPIVDDEYFNNNISIKGCYINPTKVDFDIKEYIRIEATNSDVISMLNSEFDLTSNYCPHCEVMPLDDSQNRYTRDYSLFSNIDGTINVGDLKVYYSNPLNQSKYYTKRTDNKQLPVYTNKNPISGVFNQKTNNYEYKIKPEDLIYYSHTPEDDIDELNQEDYLFCYGQEYILDGKITSDGGTIKNFNFPFVPLRELFSD